MRANGIPLYTSSSADAGLKTGLFFMRTGKKN